MTIRDLKNHIYEKVSIYTQSDDSWDYFKDIYNGKIEDIPDDLLDLEVHVIGAKRKGIIDISVKEH